MNNTVMEPGQVYKITQNESTVEIPTQLWNALLDDLDELAAKAIDLRIKLVTAANIPDGSQPRERE